MTTYSPTMETYITQKSLNLELFNLTLMSIFCHNEELENKVDIVKDFILLTEFNGKFKVNKFVKVHAFEEVYVLNALKELKKLKKLDAGS